VVYWLELAVGDEDGVVYWLELAVGDVWTVWYTGCYVVPATQITTFLLLYSCNNITLKMASTAAETRYREQCQILQCFVLAVHTIYIFVYLVQGPTG